MIKYLVCALQFTGLIGGLYIVFTGLCIKDACVKTTGFTYHLW